MVCGTRTLARWRPKCGRRSLRRTREQRRCLRRHHDRVLRPGRAVDDRLRSHHRPGPGRRGARGSDGRGERWRRRELRQRASASSSPSRSPRTSCTPSSLRRSCERRRLDPTPRLHRADLRADAAARQLHGEGLARRQGPGRSRLLARRARSSTGSAGSIPRASSAGPSTRSRCSPSARSRCSWLYAFQRLQAHLPLNPDHLAAVKPDLAWNTSVSFITNTNWQSYGSEATISYFSQMVGLASRTSFRRRRSRGDGGPDPRLSRRGPHGGQLLGGMVRSVFCILRRSLRSRSVLIQGVVQNFHLVPRHNDGRRNPTPGDRPPPKSRSSTGHQRRWLLQHELRPSVREPNGFSNMVEMLAILLIAVASTFGMVGCSRAAPRVGDLRRDGRLFTISIGVAVGEPMAILISSGRGHPGGQRASRRQHGGQGDPLRAIRIRHWAGTTTDRSNGSVNACTIASRRSAGWCPWRTSCSARSSPAASAQA